MANRIKAATGEEERGSSWSDLPFGPLCLIKSHLIGTDLTRLSFVCKSWSLSPPPFPPFFSPAATLQFFKFPLLALSDDNNSSSCNFFNAVFSATYSMIIPELENSKILFSKDGWLLVMQGNFAIFLFNPFTKEKIDLPSSRLGEFKYNQFSFSSPSRPTSPDCTVVMISVTSANTISRCHIRRGQTAWITYLQFSDCEEFFPCFSNPVFHKGELFCLSAQEEKLRIFNPWDDGLPYYNIYFPPYFTRNWKCYLIDCDEDLLAVFEEFHGEWMHVYSLEKSERRSGCNIEESLGERMLFVSRTASVSATVREIFSSSQLENKVFLPRFKGEDGLFYSLSTRQLHSFGHGYIGEDFRGTEEHLNCAWIQPNFRQHSTEELNWRTHLYI